jgi:hypothetical protein
VPSSAAHSAASTKLMIDPGRGNISTKLNRARGSLFDSRVTASEVLLVEANHVLGEVFPAAAGPTSVSRENNRLFRP